MNLLKMLSDWFSHHFGVNHRLEHDIRRNFLELLNQHREDFTSQDEIEKCNNVIITSIRQLQSANGNTDFLG